MIDCYFTYNGALRCLLGNPTLGNSTLSSLRVFTFQNTSHRCLRLMQGEIFSKSVPFFNFPPLGQPKYQSLPLLGFRHNLSVFCSFLVTLASSMVNIVEEFFLIEVLQLFHLLLCFMTQQVSSMQVRTLEVVTCLSFLVLFRVFFYHIPTYLLYGGHRLKA